MIRGKRMIYVHLCTVDLLIKLHEDPQLPLHLGANIASGND